MICGVRANQSTFKEVKFSKGFNIVLADRTKESTKKDSRNGLGKSTLIEVIHFCLGARATTGKGLLVKELSKWSFTVDLILNGKPVSVTRSTADPSKFIIDAEVSDWPISIKKSTLAGQTVMNESEWNSVLGYFMFGFPCEVDDRKYQPSFRSVFPFFVRRGRDAFISAFETHRKQRIWQKQVYNAFLLGLAWEDAREWQLLRERKNLIENLKEAGKAGIMTDIVGSLGKLDTARLRLEGKVQREEMELNGFKVHSQYEEIQEETNLLTKEIHDATNENLIESQLLALYQSSTKEEQEPDPEMIIRLYEEAGTSLPGIVVKRLEEVQSFHAQLIGNRRSFLKNEIQRLERSIAERTKYLENKLKAREELMCILDAHGALEEYTRLQENHARSVAELRELEGKIKNLRSFEDKRSSLAIDLELLQQKAHRDYDERKTQRARAIDLFNLNSEALYQVPGNLIINVDASGFQFSVDIERSGSTGIDSMKVFCYDLMLAQLWSEKDFSPRLLIHDSDLFDGVDERQVAHAIELAAQESLKLDFQYICTLNSDMVPRADFTKDFNFDSYICLRLTDATDDGSLLGIRF